MRFERRHAFSVTRFSRLEPAVERVLPAQLAFLRGLVSTDVLRVAARTAERQATCPARVLIASGGISGTRYYAALARLLGLKFRLDWPEVEAISDSRDVLALGAVRLRDGSAPHWLASPEDEALLALLSGEALDDLADFAITTPAHLSALVHYRAQPSIAHLASAALPDSAPWASARDACGTWGRLAAGLALFATGVGFLLCPRAADDLFGVLFLAGMSFRLLVSAEGLEKATDDVPALSDAALPIYTVLVPLSHEAEVLPQLLEALEAIDYPRSKLEVLLLIEPEDAATRAALAMARLPPWLHVVFGPMGGRLRTKPRALNIGLALARGSHLTVFDAEDRPEPDQLRKAAARFAADPKLACLQARLSFCGADLGRTVLARLFAIEYAALFDIFNVGIARLGLPLALGGTSNHFDVSKLKAVGGWDAWNVTEDADLGLRLARFGYRADALDSTTFEAPPVELGVWLKQRRRWTKGWMQTCLVLARDAPNAARQLGPLKSGAVLLLLVNMVVAPLAFPLFGAAVAWDFLRYGVPSPANALELGEAALAGSVVVVGVLSSLWCGWVGVRARAASHLLPYLPLLMPYNCLVSWAAWGGLWDLVRAPYHWHKTPHRAAAESGPRSDDSHRPRLRVFGTVSDPARASQRCKPSSGLTGPRHRPPARR